jgi:hypothetical protein
MQPAGYATYWQYTTALAFSVVAANTPAMSRVDKAIENFILVFLCFEFLVDQMRVDAGQYVSQFKVPSYGIMARATVGQRFDRNCLAGRAPSERLFKFIEPPRVWLPIDVRPFA